jgi:hypothetical protein
MSVVETCNGHFMLLVNEGLLFPDVFVVKGVQFFEGFIVGIDLNIIVEYVLGSELLTHAEKFGKELTS